MIGPELLRIRTARELLFKLSEIAYLPCPQLTDHPQIDLREHLGVVDRPVVVEISERVEFRQDVELVL